MKRLVDVVDPVSQTIRKVECGPDTVIRLQPFEFVALESGDDPDENGWPKLAIVVDSPPYDR